MIPSSTPFPKKNLEEKIFKLEPELEAEPIDGDLVRALQTKQFRGLSPTEGLSKLVLLHEIQQSQDRSVLFVRCATNRKESDTSRQIRMFFWTMSVKDIPPTMIDHLYIGDMAGLLCALMPRHAGRPEELQAKAVQEFYACPRRAGRSLISEPVSWMLVTQLLQPV